MSESFQWNTPRGLRNSSTFECALDITDVTDDRSPSPMLPQKVRDKITRRLSAHKVVPQPECRTLNIQTDKVLQRGSSWFASRMYSALIYLNLLCWKYMARRPMRIGTTVYQLLATAGTLALVIALAVWDRHLSSSPRLFLSACVVDAGFLSGLACVFLLQLHRVLRCVEQAAIFDLMYVGFIFFASMVSLYITIVLAVAGRYEAWALLASLFSIGIVENVNMLAWTLAGPAVAGVFIVETFIRLLGCSLRCPRHEMMVMKFVYRPYRYNSVAFAQASCAICLLDYKYGEEICALACHDLHIFHEECIQEWLKKQSTCPICRKEIEFRKD